MTFKKPISINNLMVSAGGRIAALKAGAEQAQTTLSHVESALPEPLKGTVHAASFELDGTLTLIVDSGALASRVRYALPEILRRVVNADGTAPVKGRVRVRPRSVAPS